MAKTIVSKFLRKYFYRTIAGLGYFEMEGSVPISPLQEIWPIENKTNYSIPLLTHLSSDTKINLILGGKVSFWFVYKLLRYQISKYPIMWPDCSNAVGVIRRPSKVY